MDAEVVALVNSGVTTLLGLMVTDAWGRAKHAFASLLRSRDDEQTIDDLEESRQRLAAVPMESLVREDVSSEWRSRTLRALQRIPSVEEDLRRFIADYEPFIQVHNAPERVEMSATAHDNSRIYQQGYGTQYNS